MMNIACCMAMVFILLKVNFIAFSRILNFSLRIFIVEMYMVDLALAVMTIIESTF